MHISFSVDFFSLAHSRNLWALSAWEGTAVCFSCTGWDQFSIPSKSLADWGHFSATFSGQRLHAWAEMWLLETATLGVIDVQVWCAKFKTQVRYEILVPWSFVLASILFFSFLQKLVLGLQQNLSKFLFWFQASALCFDLMSFFFSVFTIFGCFGLEVFNWCILGCFSSWKFWKKIFWREVGSDFFIQTHSLTQSTLLSSTSSQCSPSICQYVAGGLSWNQLRFSHRWGSVKNFDATPGTDWTIFWCCPLGVMLNLTPAHQNFDAGIKKCNATLPVWKPQINNVQCPIFFVKITLLNFPPWNLNWHPPKFGPTLPFQSWINWRSRGLGRLFRESRGSSVKSLFSQASVRTATHLLSEAIVPFISQKKNKKLSSVWPQTCSYV